MSDPKWLAARAREFLAFVVDEKISTDQVNEWLEEHYQESFPPDAATFMHTAMYDEVSDR